MLFILGKILGLVGLILIIVNIQDKTSLIGFFIFVFGMGMALWSGNLIDKIVEQKPDAIILDTLSMNKIYVTAYEIDTTIYTKVIGDSIKGKNIRIIKQYNNRSHLAKTGLKLK